MALSRLTRGPLGTKSNLIQFSCLVRLSNQAASDVKLKDIEEDPTGLSVHEGIRRNAVFFKPKSSTNSLIQFVPANSVAAQEQLKDLVDPDNLLYPSSDVEAKSAIKLINSELLTWKKPEPLNSVNLIKYYARLAKLRLTTLVVMTTMAGYWMGFATLEPSLLAATLIGTALTSASAASLNQFLEIPFDSQMVRTRSRPLVQGQVTPLHAIGFATATGAAGLATLAIFVNPITTVLGAINLVVYSGIYTPMKRSNILNTWVGAVVGAIPPVMGYTAATGVIDPAALILGGILYSWQFPHFNALSWNLRHDYARAGYRMMSVTAPELCLRTALRHSVLLTSYCLAACHPYIGLTSVWFAMDTMPFNLYLIWLAWQFKSDPSAASSRKLFRYSLIHLPTIILLMIIAKKSLNDKSKDKEVAKS